MSVFSPGRVFEDEVRRTAEAVWQLERGTCQPEHYTSDPVLTELDGIARLRDVSHVIMATTSTRLDKVKEDVKKLNAAAKHESRRGVPVSKWLITERQLEAQHIRYARENGVTALTLQHFRARFFDGRDYIQKRRNAAFGSARNLADGTISIPEDEYVELPMTVAPYERIAGVAPSDQAKPLSLEDMIDSLLNGDVIALLAPFGAGKSLTAREVFLRVAKEHLSNRKDVTPIALNLREHWGNIYADEILERHSRSIGFTPRENLTIAWRMGIVILLLDGFDELASQAITRSTDRNFLREVRAEALRGVRDLVSKAGQGVGVLIAGRDHYFDSLRELEHSLGLTGRPFHVVRLGEFNEAQAISFLKRHSGESTLPDWLPRKPLILGYLAHKRLLRDILDIDSTRGFGFAWDSFLTLVCDREASHERAAMDSQTVRRVLERLACEVRGTSSGTGPISGIDLAEAYRLETGEVAGEAVLMQLQRLPGLTPREQDPSARSFVDEDLLAALQGSAITRVIMEGASNLGTRRWLGALSSKGIAMASYLVRRPGADVSTALAAAHRVSTRQSFDVDRQIAADVTAVAIELAREDGILDAHALVIESAAFGTLDLEDLRLDGLYLRNCFIDEVVVGSATLNSTLKITECLIGRVAGVSSAAALPPEMFQNCTTDAFDDASTTAAVMRLRVPPAVKAVVSVLRKLYLQAGGGRKLSALRRGLTDAQVSGHVDDVLRILESEGMIAVANNIAHPIRRQTARANRLLAELALSTDPVMQKVHRL